MIRSNLSVSAWFLPLLAGTANAQFTGPSSSQSPYVLPTIPGVTTTSILTVGDSVGGYSMVGSPDGLGAFGTGVGNSFTLLMNHELSATAGSVRAHGQTGAFVSRWQINPDLSVSSGRDFNTSAADAYIYNSGTGVWTNAGSSAQRWNRFCSGDLAAPSAYYDPASGLGTQARIYLNGEEAGTEGRAIGHITTGPAMNQSWQLPHLGKFSWENAVACPFAQQKTIVMGTDDSSPGQVYMYVGDKTSTGNDIERAGLTNGILYGVRVIGLPTEIRASPASGRFDLYNHGNAANITGITLNSNSNTNSVTNFLRPEDAAWDPRPGHQNDFYFITTDRFNTVGQQGNTRLYRLRFDDISNPLAGGSISMLIDGFTDGPNMMDNMCIDSHGRVIIQEDIGGQSALGKVWLYDIDSTALLQVAQHDPSRFLTGGANFLTVNEESTGVIDASNLLGDGWFLFDIMAHYAITGELVEGGQLSAIYIDPNTVPCLADVDDGSGTGTPDLGVTIDDLLYYLAIFEAGDLDADVDDGSGTGTPDSGVTIDDLLFYLQRFEAGC